MINRNIELISISPLQGSLAYDVANSLRNAIFAGQFLPGERLLEQPLAETLGVSRGPVREALNQLEREGLVTTWPNRGTFVSQFSYEDLEEVFGLRLALEPLAVQQAILKANASDIANLQAKVNTMAAFVESGITEYQAAELDMGFHDLLWRASKHKRLIDIWINLQPQIWMFLLTRNISNSDFREYAVKSHQEILDAIREKDEPRAVLRINQHIHAAFNRISETYKQ